MTIKCPGCGAALVYDAASNMMMCEHCVSYYSVEETGYRSEDENASENRYEEETGEDDLLEYEVYKCTECGAELVINGTESSTFCAYCGQPSIVMSRIIKQKKPDFILPFTVTKQEALEIIRKKFKKGFFVSKNMKEFEVDKLHGIYIPFRLYDIDYRDEQILKGEVGSGKSKRTKYFYRYAESMFHNITIDASVMLNDDSSVRLEPYDIKKCIPFSKEYMSGFYSNIMDDDSLATRVKGLKRAGEMFSDEMRKSVEASNVKTIRMNPYMKIVSERYAMLPTWFVSFNDNGRNNTIMVNGQTGKCVGAVEADIDRKWTLFMVLSGVLIPLFNYILAIFINGTNDVEKRLESMIMLTLGLAVVISMAFNYRREFNKSRNLTTAVDMKEFANDRQEGDI